MYSTRPAARSIKSPDHGTSWTVTMTVRKLEHQIAASVLRTEHDHAGTNGTGLYRTRNGACGGVGAAECHSGRRATPSILSTSRNPPCLFTVTLKKQSSCHNKKGRHRLGGLKRTLRFHLQGLLIDVDTRSRFFITKLCGVRRVWLTKLTSTGLPSRTTRRSGL